MGWMDTTDRSWVECRKCTNGLQNFFCISFFLSFINFPSTTERESSNIIFTDRQTKKEKRKNWTDLADGFLESLWQHSPDLCFGFRSHFGRVELLCWATPMLIHILLQKDCSHLSQAQLLLSVQSHLGQNHAIFWNIRIKRIDSVSMKLNRKELQSGYKLTM